MSLIVEFMRNRLEQLMERPFLWWDELKVNDRIRTRNRHLVAALRNAKNEAERDSLLREDHHTSIEEHEERELLASRRLRIIAQRLRVPEPALMLDDITTENINIDDWFTDDWIRSSEGPFYLSQKGFKKLRQDIREELLRRREVRFPWVSWLTACTGLLGTLTGLIALIRHTS